MATPAYAALKQTAGAASTSKAIVQDSGTSIGDLLLIGAVIDLDGGTASLSVGTKLGQTETTSGSGGERFLGAWFWFIATGAGEKTIGTLSWGGSSVYNIAAVTRTTGAHPTEPVVTSKLQANNSSSTAMKFGSVTPPVAECLAVLLGQIDQAGTGTPPAGYAERLDNEGGNYVATSSGVLVPEEATGEKTVTLTAPRFTNTAHIVVQPPAAATSPHRLALLGVGR